MKTGILSGRFVTRIRDFAYNIPKPKIPRGGYPILGHVIKYFATSGLNRFTFCLG